MCCNPSIDIFGKFKQYWLVFSLLFPFNDFLTNPSVGIVDQEVKLASLLLLDPLEQLLHLDNDVDDNDDHDLDVDVDHDFDDDSYFNDDHDFNDFWR